MFTHGRTPLSLPDQGIALAQSSFLEKIFVLLVPLFLKHFLRNEAESGGIHTVTFARWCWTIIKYVAKV